MTGYANSDGMVAADAMRFKTTERYYYHPDHLGTPQKLTNQAQQVVWDASYKPFGEATVLTSTVTQPLRFPGQYFDAETGLHQNWHRDYDPSIGRYLQSDPTGLAAGLNTYAYVDNNPLRYVDPLGLDRNKICKDYDSLKPVCEACVKAACSFAPIYCCEVDKKDCQGDADGDPTALATCEAQYIACIANVPKAKKMHTPPKPPEDI